MPIWTSVKCLAQGHKVVAHFQLHAAIWRPEERFVLFDSFTSHQQSFSYIGTSLPGLNQYLASIPEESKGLLFLLPSICLCSLVLNTGGALSAPICCRCNALQIQSRDSAVFSIYITNKNSRIQCSGELKK